MELQGMVPEVAKKFKYWQTRTIIASMIGYALFYFVRKNLSIAMPAMQDDLGITKGDLGLFLTLHGLLYGVSKFANGFVGDRVNARYFMVTGLVLSAACNIWFGFSSAVVMFGIVWMLNGWFQDVTEVTVADLKKNQLVIEDIEFKADYVLFMIAVDADGNPSTTMTKKEYTSAKPTFVRIEKDADLWKAGEPEVTIDKIEKDKFYTVTYTVKPKAGCKQFYVFAGSADYLTGMFDEQIKYVMKYGVKQTTTYSGSIYGPLPTNINVTWVDAEGRLYELSKTVVNVPAQ